MPLTAYQRRLLVFLSVATFFEGYDVFAISQILPSLRREMALSEADAGALLSVMAAGGVLAYFLVRKADDWGRRRVLAITIAGYTLCSLLTAASPNIFVFGAFQLGGRVFLAGEYAIAMVYAAEEYPAARRGRIIGALQVFAVLGGMLCSVLTPMLLKTPLGWRAVFLVGGVPLMIVAFARRGIRETERFAKSRQDQSSVAQSFLRLVRSPYRGRLFLMALIWCLTLSCANNAVTFWKEFATSERQFTDADIALGMVIAGVGSLPMLSGVGRLIDWLGRRRSAVVIFVTASVSVFCSYTLTSRVGLVVALMLGVVGTQAVFPILNAYTTELFPTHLRSDAFAWSFNLLGRAVYALSPYAIGVAAERVGWGEAVAATSVLPLIALGLIWVLLPETGGKELEETSVVH